MGTKWEWKIHDGHDISRGTLAVMEVGLQGSRPLPQSQERIRLVRTTSLHHDTPNRAALRVRNIPLVDSRIKARKLMRGGGRMLEWTWRIVKKGRVGTWGVDDGGSGSGSQGGAKILPSVHLTWRCCQQSHVTKPTIPHLNLNKFLLPNLGLLSYAKLQCGVFGIPLSVSVLHLTVIIEVTY